MNLSYSYTKMHSDRELTDHHTKWKCKKLHAKNCSFYHKYFRSYWYEYGKGEQIQLPNNEHLSFWPNYLCAYAQYIDAHVCRIWSFYHKHFRSDWHKCGKQITNYGCQMCFIGHMTFTFEFDLAIVRVNIYAKIEDAPSSIQELLC